MMESLIIILFLFSQGICAKVFLRIAVIDIKCDKNSSYPVSLYVVMEEKTSRGLTTDNFKFMTSSDEATQKYMFLAKILEKSTTMAFQIMINGNGQHSSLTSKILLYNVEVDELFKIFHDALSCLVNLRITISVPIYFTSQTIFSLKLEYYLQPPKDYKITIENKYTRPYIEPYIERIETNSTYLRKLPIEKLFEKLIEFLNFNAPSHKLIFSSGKIENHINSILKKIESSIHHFTITFIQKVDKDKFRINFQHYGGSSILNYLSDKCSGYRENIECDLQGRIRCKNPYMAGSIACTEDLRLSVSENNPCNLNNPCQNQGKCHLSKFLNKMCECPANCHGRLCKRCDDTDRMKFLSILSMQQNNYGKNCRNGGTMNHDTKLCTCKSPYLVGKFCEYSCTIFCDNKCYFRRGFITCYEDILPPPEPVTEKTSKKTLPVTSTTVKTKITSVSTKAIIDETTEGPIIVVPPVSILKVDEFDLNQYETLALTILAILIILKILSLAWVGGSFIKMRSINLSQMIPLKISEPTPIEDPKSFAGATKLSTAPVNNGGYYGLENEPDYYLESEPAVSVKGEYVLQTHHNSQENTDDKLSVTNTGILNFHKDEPVKIPINDDF